MGPVLEEPALKRKALRPQGCPETFNCWAGDSLTAPSPDISRAEALIRVMSP